MRRKCKAAELGSGCYLYIELKRVGDEMFREEVNIFIYLFILVLLVLAVIYSPRSYRANPLHTHFLCPDALSLRHRLTLYQHACQFYIRAYIYILFTPWRDEQSRQINLTPAQTHDKCKMCE